MIGYSKDLIYWKLLHEEEYSPIDSSQKSYNLHLSEILSGFKHPAYTFPIDFHKFELPHSYKLIKNEELLLAHAVLFNLLTKAEYTLIPKIEVLKMIDSQLFKVYREFSIAKLNKFYLADLMFCKQTQSIQGIIIIGQENNHFIFHNCSLLYLICLSEAYKLFLE